MSKKYLLLPLCLAVLLNTALYLPLQRQTTAPLLAAPAQQGEQGIVAVVDADGSNLYAEVDSAVVQALPPGTILTVVGRTADAQWLAVQTAAQVAGWVPTRTVVVFGVDQAPIIRPIEPAAQTSVATTTLPASTSGAVTATLPISVPVNTTGPSPTATLSMPLSSLLPATAFSTGTDERSTVRILSKGLNIRSGPGINFAVVGEARQGERFVEIGRSRDGAWVQIEIDAATGKTGWVSAGYVRSGAAQEPGESAAVTEPNADASAAEAAAPTGETESDANPAGSEPEPGANASAAERVAAARPAGLSGRLVIQSTWGGLFYLYDLATGELRALTGGLDPAISPDGRQIAFTRLDGEANGLYLIDSNGGNERKIFGERAGLMSPKWSPTGDALVFSYNDGFYQCRLMGFSSCLSEKQIIEQLNLPPNREVQRKIISEFDRENRPNWRLAQIDTAGAGYRDLAVLDSARAPDWTEGGIVYHAAGGIQLTQAEAEAENQFIFADGHGYDWDPDWQTGGRIVFQSREGSHWEIFAVNPDGSGHTALTRPVTALVPQLPSNVAPVWSPDGRHIAFLSNRGADHSAGAWRVWVMDADGGNQRPLPIDLAIHYGFSGEQMISWGP